jgi:uncharacterized protein YuzE
MKIQYDSEADALYIQVRRARPHHGIDIPGARGFSVDVDRKGNIVGIEILHASKALGKELCSVTVEDFGPIASSA